MVGQTIQLPYSDTVSLTAYTYQTRQAHTLTDTNRHTHKRHTPKQLEADKIKRQGVFIPSRRPNSQKQLKEHWAVWFVTLSTIMQHAVGSYSPTSPGIEMTYIGGRGKGLTHLPGRYDNRALVWDIPGGVRVEVIGEGIQPPLTRFLPPRADVYQFDVYFCGLGSV